MGEVEVSSCPLLPEQSMSESEVWEKMGREKRKRKIKERLAFALICQALAPVELWMNTAGKVDLRFCIMVENV